MCWQALTKLVTQSKKAGSNILLSRITRLSADRKNLTHSVCEVERGNPVWLLVYQQGQCVARYTYGCAGIGGQEKRKPCCNNKDTDCNSRILRGQKQLRVSPKAFHCRCTRSLLYCTSKKMLGSMDFRGGYQILFWQNFPWLATGKYPDGQRNFE